MAIIDIRGATASNAQDYTARFARDITLALGQDTDFAPETPQAQLAGTLGASHAILDSAIVELWNAYNVNTAEGVNLDNICAWLGIFRLDAARSTATVTFTGTAGTSVPAGTRIRSVNGDFFTTDVTATIASGATTVSVLVSSVDFGRVRVGVGDLNTLATTVVGITSVTNATAGTVGRLVETDDELRSRYFDVISFNSLGSLPSLQASILDVPGVTYCVVRDNPTAAGVTISGVAIGARSFVAVVEGGTDTDVATAVAFNKPMGISPSGTTSEKIRNLSGFDEDISFERVTTLPVKVVMQISSTVDFPGNGSALIKQALLDYVAALQPGDTVNTDRMRAGTLNAVGFFNIDSFTVTDTSDTALPATTPLNRRLTLALNNITVTVT